MSQESTAEHPVVLTFKEFRKAEEISPGTKVTGVKPADLYTTQDWIEGKKVQAALNREIDPNDEYPSEGYVHRNAFGKTILVLGDGNTKSITAWVRGKRVNFTVKGPLPEGQRYFPLSRLRNNYHDLFTGFDYQ